MTPKTEAIAEVDDALAFADNAPGRFGGEHRDDNSVLGDEADNGVDLPG